MFELNDLPFKGGVPTPSVVSECITTLSAAQEWGEATNYLFTPLRSLRDEEVWVIACFSPHDERAWLVPVFLSGPYPTLHCSSVADALHDGNVPVGFEGLYASVDLTETEFACLSGGCHTA